MISYNDTSLRRKRTISSDRRRVHGGGWMLALQGSTSQEAVTRGEGENNAAKLVRACGGCLGTRRRKGVEDCEKSGGVVKRALIPEYPCKPRELKHLITWWKRKQKRFRQ